MTNRPASGRIRRERRNGCLAGIIVILVIAGGLWWLWENAFLRPYSGETLRAQWTADGTLANLKSWAEEVIAGKRSSRNWPKVPEPASIGVAYTLRDRDERVIAVAFEMGGADNHHGLIIGQRPENFFPVRAQWEGRVWWYDEVPNLDERSHRKLAGKAQ
jgi:hypothetical protein